MLTTEKLRRLLQPYRQESVARVAGLSPVTISKIANGKVASLHLRTIQGIARAVGVDIAWLTDDTRGWPPVRTSAAGIDTLEQREHAIAS